MERTRIKEVRIEGLVLGTTDVMDWADAHPEHYFDFTAFDCDRYPYGGLMVSEYEPSERVKEYLDGLGWHDIKYNGWQRTSDGFGWVCRKNGRYIYITN